MKNRRKSEETNILEMQRELDTAILKQHGNIYDENIAEQTKIALFVELGEMMNELPTCFKHWKFTAKDDRKKALIEYVDALHFQMSLFNHYKLNIDNILIMINALNMILICHFI